MKTINIKDIEIQEVIITPKSDKPISVYYSLKDDNDELVTFKRVYFDKDKVPGQIFTNLLELVSKIFQKLKTDESL